MNKKQNERINRVASGFRFRACGITGGHICRVGNGDDAQLPIACEIIRPGVDQCHSYKRKCDARIFKLVELIPLPVVLETEIDARPPAGAEEEK